jgi:hypothetical protein
MSAPPVRVSKAVPPPGTTGDQGPDARRLYFVLVALVLATTGAVLVGDGDLYIAVAPMRVALVVWGVWVLPLRVTLAVLLALAWGLEVPGDVFASGLIRTPWEIEGRLFWSKLNLVIPFPPLVMTGFDLLALVLFVVVVHRHVKRSTIDRIGWVDAPKPIATFAWLSVLSALAMSLYGLVQGGSFRFLLWQSTKWLYLPIVYAFMREGLRGVQDAKLMGRVLLGVGVFRAIEAIAFRLMFPSTNIMPHATSHADSVLFASCACILGAMLLEMHSKQVIRLCGILLPIFVWAMVANKRRLVWAEIALVVPYFWLITPWRPLKRTLLRTAARAAIPLLLYGAVGWNSQGGVFRPVQLVRSIFDSQRDASTLWRDHENFDLIYTFSHNPLFGSGFGHPFEQKVALSDVTRVYELEPYIPHNSVLGLWAFGGLVGFSLLWMVFPVGVFFTVRAYRVARTPLERVTALGAAAIQISYLLQGYGDLGFGNWGAIFTVAASYALVGKICTRNGGWDSPNVNPRATPKSRLAFGLRSVGRASQLTSSGLQRRPGGAP